MEKDTLGFGKKKKRKRFPKRMKNHSDIGVWVFTPFEEI